MSLTPQAARGPQATTAVPVLQPGHPEALAGAFSFPSLLLKGAFSWSREVAVAQTQGLYNLKAKCSECLTLGQAFPFP